MKALLGLLGYLKGLLAAILMILGIAEVATAAPMKVTGDVTWKAKAIAGLMTIAGEGGKVDGTVEVGADGKAAGELVCDVGAFKTGIDLRDKHLHEKYLGSGKAMLKLDSVKATAEDFDWTGQLTIKGETKPVKGKGRLKGDDLWAKFDVKLTDYPAIGAPAWEDVAVADLVVVVVNAKAK